jgi:protein-disulfide isomerase
MTKLILNSKIFFLTKILIISIIVILNSYADESNEDKNIISIGPNEAVVKIKIFSSLTCPHCANFHIKVVPKIIKEYVESGKVQLIFIDFPLDLAAFNASKLLHCLDQKKQISFLDIVYDTQSNWANGSNIEDINNNLKKIAKNLGISSEQFDKCLIDEDISDKILNNRIEANQKYSISSTPTIVINEKKLEGSVSFKNIKKKIEKII